METLKEKLIVAQKLSEKYLRMTHESIEALSSILICKEIEKNQFLLKEGEICEYLYFVDKGMLRQFYYKYGRDMTEHFAIENELSFNVESYLFQKPSKLMVETLEPSVVYCISNKALFALINKNAEVNTMYRLLLESLLIQYHQRLDALRLDLALERYIRFLKESPEIVQRAPLLHIASYLLMSPETLSRVRSSFINVKNP
ncbi:MAG: Crp/Fnr family transcriptional regulator [Tannerellaceae bacterium]|nr:Crp/Fnr family transcriptional regulator [Tannerellaceae bacterium]